MAKPPALPFRYGFVQPVALTDEMPGRRLGVVNSGSSSQGRSHRKRTGSQLREEPSTAGSGSESGLSLPQPEGRAVPSSAERRITALVHEFVLQLFLRRRDFWDAVRDLRVRWNVSAETRLPPSDDAPVYPPPESGRGVSSELEKTQEAYQMRLDRLRDELGTLHDRFVPIGCRTSTRGSISRESWENCLSALVLYDPPETQLVKFADLVSPGPINLCPHCTGVGQVPDGTPLKVEGFDRDLSGMPSMVAPPIEYLRDPGRVEKDTEAHWRDVIDELALRLEPRGIDIKAMVDDILEDPRIQAEKKKRADQNLPKPYIVVDEFTTDEDASRAHSMIASVHGWDSKGGST